MLKTKIQEKFEKIWSRFVEVVAILKFPPIWSNVKENDKNLLKFKISRCPKSEKVTL